MDDQTIFEIHSSLKCAYLIAKDKIKPGTDIKTILSSDEFKEKEKELRDDIAKGRLKSEPLSYFVMTINMNGKSLGEGSAASRLLLLAIILRNFTSSVIFAQELLSQKNMDNLIEALKDKQGTLCWEWTEKGSAVIWNNSEFEATIEGLKSSDTRITGIRDDLQRKGFQVSETLSKITMVKLTRRNKESENIPDDVMQTFLAVSWHGPHYKCSDDNKRKGLTGLLELVKEVCKVEGNIPFIIGGDFNLDTTVNDHLDVVVPSYDYELSRSGRCIPHKDNFMFSVKNISVKWVRPLDITSREEETRAGCDLSFEEQNEVKQISVDPQRGVVDDLLDHDAVVGVLQLGRSVVKNLCSEFWKLKF